MKYSKPLFTILLPTHNRQDVISYSIKSILSQSISDFELLIVGDGCSDLTEEIVRNLALGDRRIKWFPFPKGAGFGYAHRNTVLKKAQGKYLAFAAHDDLWFPDHLEKILKFIKKNSAFSIVYTRPLWMHPDGTLVVSTFNTNYEKVKRIFLNSHNEIPAHCVVSKLQDAKKVGFLNIELRQAADWDLWKRIINLGRDKEIGFIPDPTTIHFKADWRKEENFWNQRLRELHKRIRKSTLLAKLLAVRLEKGKILQKIVWEKYMSKPGWIDRVRVNSTTALDSLIEDLSYILEDNFELKLNMQAMTKTRGYKLLTSIRKLVKSF